VEIGIGNIFNRFINLIRLINCKIYNKINEIGNLSTNFMVNGFNGYYFYMLWWLMFILVKLGSKLYLRGLIGK